MKKNSFLNWFFFDFPPLDGRVRFVFFIGLIYLSGLHSKSPFLGIHLYEKTSPEFFNTFGFLKFIGFPYLSVECLKILIFVCKISMVCSAIGLFLPFTNIISALIFALLHGMFLATNAFNNAWFVPVYALFSLCFVKSSDQWSVDYLISRYLRTNKKKKKSMYETGFGIKIFFILCALFYFSAAWSKLYYSGIWWFDGNSLKMALNEKYNPEFSRWISKFNFLMISGALITIIVESMGIIAIFYKKLRNPFLLSILGFHITVRALMYPWYYSNCLCLILLVDWKKKNQEDFDVKSNLVLNIFSLGLCLIMIFGAVKSGITQISWWPFTNTSMYSEYNSNDYKGGLPIADYRNKSIVQKIARDCLIKNCGRHRLKNLFLNIQLVLVSKHEKIYLLDKGIGVAKIKQWHRVIFPDIMLEYLAFNIKKVSFQKRKLPIDDLLKKLIPLIKDKVVHWENYKKIQFLYSFEDENLILAEKLLN